MMEKGFMMMRGVASACLIVLASSFFYHAAQAQNQTPATNRAVPAQTPAVTAPVVPIPGPGTAAALATSVPSQSTTLAQPQIQLTPKNPDAPVVLPPVRSKFRQMLDRWYFLMTGRRADNPDPTATLVAPFADDTATPAKPNERTVMRLLSKESSLDQPHRSAADLSDWLMQAMSELLSFTADGYNDHLKAMSRGMSPEGLAQFNAWVTSSGILNALQANGLQLNGFVEEKPFLLNEGAIAGRYRWLFEIPVQVSFVPRGTTDLNKSQGVSTKKLIITLQVGRVAESELINHVIIETWSVQDNTRKN
jgi:hypothetical protein